MQVLVCAAALFITFAFCPHAEAIEYASGTRVNTTFTTTVGTKAELVAGVESCLTSAGWTVQTGAGTSNVRLKSATTPQNLAMQVRVYDGGGSNARLKPGNADFSGSMSGDHFIAVAAGYVFRCVANPYQLFLARAGGPHTSISTVQMGVPWMPAWNTGIITDAVWSVSDGTSDGDGTCRANFRRCLVTLGCPGCGNTGNHWTSLNGAAIEGTNFNTDTVGHLRLASTIQTYLDDTLSAAVRWADDSYLISDALIAWGPALGSEGKIIGQIWDCGILAEGSQSIDSSFTFDTFSFFVWTGVNAGDSASARGQLICRVP